MGRTPPFPNPPLVLTVMEIRYPEIAGGIREQMQIDLKTAVNEYLPLMEPQTEQQITMAVDASEPMSMQQRAFPRFSTRDRTTALVVKQEALILETTAYKGWEESFRPLISKAVSALEEVAHPDGVQRVGLRYIDEIRVPGIESTPGDWRGYIDDHLLAATNPDFIPASLRPSVWKGLVQYQTATDSTLAIRFGPQQGYAVDPKGPTRRKNPSTPGLFFLLDSDSYWLGEEEVPEFKTDWILERCDRLHEPVREFFRIAATNKLRNEVFSLEKGATP